MNSQNHRELSYILGETQIITDLKGNNRWEAIDELVEILVGTGKIRAEHRAAVTGLVKKREASMSTGIGFGIGIPHATTNLISEVIGAMGRWRTAVDFEALDGQPVTLVILLLVPQGQFREHLRMLANFTRLLHKFDVRQALEQASDAAAMWRVLRDQEATAKAENV